MNENSMEKLSTYNLNCLNLNNYCQDKCFKFEIHLILFFFLLKDLHQISPNMLTQIYGTHMQHDIGLAHVIPNQDINCYS